MVNYIQVENLTKSFGDKLLFENISFGITDNQRVALIAKNGTGKSTLLNILANRESPDSGHISFRKDLRIGYLEQSPELPSELSVIDACLQSDNQLMNTIARYEHAMLHPENDTLSEVLAEMEMLKAWDYESRIKQILGKLKITNFEQKIGELSGGQLKRIALANVLISEPELLILDEPTNHLDLDALVWLEGWLKRYPGTLLVISHDREFLDAITQVTVHVEHAQLTRYSGNYTAFEEQRAERIVLQQAAYARQQEKIAHLQQFIDRFKAKATKAKQAQSRVKALERMERLAPVLTSADFTFEFQEPPQLPNPMLAVRDAAFGYRGAAGKPAPDLILDAELQDFSTSQELHQHQLQSGEALPPITEQDKVILQGINVSVLAGQRIGVLGANGQGKSTFVKTVAHALPLLAGRITEGKGLRLGYFAQQELDVLQLDDHPLGHMTRLAREHPDLAAQAGREQDLRNFLGSFQFAGDMVHQAVGSMSGGEKARLVLAMLVWQRPNLLLLDEPTNHLDLVTREALAMALNSFDGTVMLVSHDRALLRAVCDDFWLVGEGGIRPFDGDLDDYQRYLQDVARQRREQLNAGNSASADATDSKPALSGAEQRKLQAARRQQYLEQRRPLAKRQQQLEKDMEQLRADKERLEAELCQPLEPQAIADAGRQLKQVTDDLDEAEMAWLEVSEQLEALEASQEAV